MELSTCLHSLIIRYIRVQQTSAIHGITIFKSIPHFVTDNHEFSGNYTNKRN